MRNISKYKVDPFLFISVLLLATISILTIYSAQTILDDKMQDLALKQFIWYLLGFGIVYMLMYIGNDFIYKHAWKLYWLGNLALLGLLFFAKPINDARCWYSIPKVGTIQPSEFMKIILILILSKVIHDFHENHVNPTVKEEFFFLIKVGLILILPSALTFLQPDTGVVFIYLLIAIVMLFIAGIRYRWFILLFSIFGIAIGIVLFFYFINQEYFIKLFGTSFFLRVDRLLDWSNKSGYQLVHGSTAIGSAGLLGHGFRNTPLYFPEAQTDFIFAVFASNFGLIGSFFLLLLLAFFDIKLILTALKTDSNQNRYMIAGIVGMLIYQQVQNIGMTYGILPITGITLPFISYGGSSLLSYMIIVGIIFNISNESLRYKH